MVSENRIIFIVGPTAAGKSDVALELGKTINGEIVSCDSMQIYKEISIASNKPDEEDLRKLRHHLIGIVSVNEEFNAAHFSRLSIEAIKSVHDRQKTAIIVAGSGMYMQILLDGIFESQGKDPHVREKLKKRAEKEGVHVLYNELNVFDPTSAKKIHPHDARRIIRALEVYQSTQQPISRLQQNRKGLWGQFDIHVFGLNWDREMLNQRINERVERMFEKGLIDEISALKNRHLSLTAQHVIGINEVGAYLNGELDLLSAKEKMKQNTRRLAKRQMTWFRKEKRIEWIPVENCLEVDVIVNIILEKLK